MKPTGTGAGNRQTSLQGLRCGISPGVLQAVGYQAAPPEKNKGLQALGWALADNVR